MTARIIAMRGRVKDGAYYQNLELGVEISNALTTVTKDNLIVLIYE